MAGYDPWASTNAGLVNLGSNISNINNRRIADSENQRRNSLADLQIQQTKNTMAKDDLNAPLEAKQREATMISLDDQLAEYKAKVEAGGGSAEEYYKGQQTLTKMKQFGEIVKQNIRNLPQVWPQIVAAFPEMKDVDPSQFQQTADGIAHPFKTPDGQVVPNTYYIYDNDGKMVIKEVKQEAKGFDTIDLGDRIKVVPRDGSAPTIERKAVPPAVQVRVDAGKNSGGGGNGKAPSGYRYTADGNLEPIPGGPAAAKSALAARGDENSKAAIDLSINTIDKLMTHPGRQMATGKSRMTGAHKIPGTDAYDFDKELESFDAQLFLSNISAMKGMGALSNAEGMKVSAAAGAIKPGMSEGAFLSNIKSIRDTLALAKKRYAGGIVINPDGTTQKPQPTAGPKLGTVQDGYRFRGGDPADPKSWVKVGR